MMRGAAMRGAMLVAAAAALAGAGESARHQAAEFERESRALGERLAAEQSLADQARDGWGASLSPPPTRGWDVRGITQAARRGRKLRRKQRGRR